MELPVRHGEGKFVTRDDEVARRLIRGGQIAMMYGRSDKRSDLPVHYPENPNGSELNAAGVCDPTGRILGLMPHPERHIDPTHHPRWTRGEQDGSGRPIFENAVRYFE